MIPKIILQSIWALLILALFVVYLRYLERKTLFYPTKEIEYLPKEAGLDYEDILFKIRDNVELNGWFVPAPNARCTILFCHGNAGNISHRIEKIRFFHDLGCNVFIFDYRGYGKSKGRPSENGVYSDVQAAYDYLLSRGIKPEQIIGYGESIGSASIIDLASKNKVAALIIDSGFTNAKDMIKKIYPFLPYWIFASRWESLEKIKSMTVPKLIIHSVNDEIVPYKLGKKLYDAAREPKEFLEVHGGHNSCFFESEAAYKEKVSGFIKTVTK